MIYFCLWNSKNQINKIYKNINSNIKNKQIKINSNKININQIKSIMNLIIMKIKQK